MSRNRTVTQFVHTPTPEEQGALRKAMNFFKGPKPSEVVIPTDRPFTFVMNTKLSNSGNDGKSPLSPLGKFGFNYANNNNSTLDGTPNSPLGNTGGGGSTTMKETDFWVSDTAATSCKLCERPFTFLFRKHHCRMCGDVFCLHCSPYVTGNAFGYRKDVRVCLKCQKKSASGDPNTPVLATLTSMPANNNTFEPSTPTTLMKDYSISAGNEFDLADLLREESVFSRANPDNSEDAGEDLEHPGDLLATKAYEQLDNDTADLLPCCFAFAPSVNKAHQWDKRLLRRSSTIIPRRPRTIKSPPTPTLPGFTFAKYMNDPEGLPLEHAAEESILFQVSNAAPDSPRSAQQVSTTIDFVRRSVQGTTECTLRHLDSVLRRILSKHDLVHCTDSLRKMIWHVTLNTNLANRTTNLQKVVKVMCVEGRNLDDSFVVEGIAFRGNVRHNAMRTNITNPKVLLLLGNVGFESNFMTRVTDMDELATNAEQRCFVTFRRIHVWRPSIVITEGSVHHLLLSMLLQDGVTVITGIKRTLMEKIAGAINGNLLDDIESISIPELFRSEYQSAQKEQGNDMAAINSMGSNPTGTCRSFRVVSVAGNPLVLLEGLENRCFTSVILRGLTRPNLKILKNVFRHGLLCARHMLVEANLLYDFRVGYLGVRDEAVWEGFSLTSISPCITFTPLTKREPASVHTTYQDPDEHQCLLVQQISVQSEQSSSLRLADGPRSLNENDTATINSRQESKLRYYPYYDEQEDTSLSGFLQELFKEGTHTLITPPQRMYLHNMSRIVATVERSTAKLPRTTSVWRHCKMCNQTTRKLRLSQLAQTISFGKFLETWFYNSHQHTMECGHSFQHDTIRYFGACVASFNVIVRLEHQSLPMLRLVGPERCVDIESIKSDCERFFEDEREETVVLITETNLAFSTALSNAVPQHALFNSPLVNAAYSSKDEYLKNIAGDWMNMVRMASSRADLLCLRDEINRFSNVWKMNVLEVSRAAESYDEEISGSPSSGPTEVGNSRRVTMAQATTAVNLNLPAKLLPTVTVLDRDNPLGMVKLDDPSSIVAWALASHEVTELRPVPFVNPVSHQLLNLDRLTHSMVGMHETDIMADELNVPDETTLLDETGTYMEPRYTTSHAYLSLPVEDRIMDVLNDRNGAATRRVLVTKKMTSGLTSHRIDVEVFFPEQFMALMNLYTNRNDSIIIQSLLQSTPFKPTGGKSSATFIITRDKRFILKQISNVELKHFAALAQQYFIYMAQVYSNSDHERCSSVLAKILGSFSIRVRSRGSLASYTNFLSETKAFILMENIFHDFTPITTYDLKGSQRNRLQMDQDAVQLDENLLLQVNTGDLLFVADYDKSWLDRAIALDSELLADQRIMDYSLLVGVNSSGVTRLGIIDYIRAYTIDKQLESLVKTHGIIGPAGEPTVIEPRHYRDRFKKWMCKYFCTVPDKLALFRRKANAEKRKAYAQIQS